MHQNSEAKQPKETDEIKKKLESYAALHRRIDNQIERLENLEAVMGSISSPSFDGISGGGGDGTSKQERQVIQKVTLEETIRRMIADEDQERSELEALISEMEKPDGLRRTRAALPQKNIQAARLGASIAGQNIQSKTRTGITTPARSHRKADGGLFFVCQKKYAHTQEKAADGALTSTQGDKKGQKGIKGDKPPCYSV